jgi:hypothetical protein
MAKRRRIRIVVMAGICSLPAALSIGGQARRVGAPGRRRAKAQGSESDARDRDETDSSAS